MGIFDTVGPIPGSRRHNAPQHDGDAADKRRMDAAADFAFRQAWALCPYSPEAVFRYVPFLMRQKRIADALVVAETAAKFRSEPGVGQLDQLVANLIAPAANSGLPFHG